MKLSEIYTTGTVVRSVGSIAPVCTRTIDEMYTDVGMEFDTSILLCNGSTSEMLNKGAYGSNFTAYTANGSLQKGETTSPINFLGCVIIRDWDGNNPLNLTRKIISKGDIYGVTWDDVKNLRFVTNVVSSEGISESKYQPFDIATTSNVIYDFNSTFVEPNFNYSKQNAFLSNTGFVNNPLSLTGDDAKRIYGAQFTVNASIYNKYINDSNNISKQKIGNLGFIYLINNEYFLLKSPISMPDSGYDHNAFTIDNVKNYLTIGGFSDFENGNTGFLPNDDETKGAYPYTQTASGSYKQSCNYYVTANCALYVLNSCGLRWVLTSNITTAKNFRDNVRLGVMDKNGIIKHKEWITGESGIQASDNPNKDTSYDNIPDRPTPSENNDDIESVGYGYFSNAVMGTLYSLYNKLDLEKIAQWFYNQTEKIDIANNVISLKEIPFSLATLNIVPIDTDLKIGGVNVTYNNENIKVGQIVSPATTSLSVLFGEFNIPRLSNTFLDYSPYTKYELLLPFAPTPVTLPDWCVNKTVSAIFLYDIYTTACQYVIECNGERICSVSGIFGVDRPISAQNVALKDASRLSAQVATASSVLGGVMSSASGNIGGIVSGAIGGVSALSQIIMSGKQNYMYTVGANGDSSSVGLCHAVHLKITRTLSAEDSNFTHVYGRPLCKYKKLSSVTGYTKCDSVNTNGLSCSENEKQMIKRLLETGIYI